MTDAWHGGATWEFRLRTLAHAVLVIFVVFLCATLVAGLGAGALLSTNRFDPNGLGTRVALTVLQFVGFAVGVGAYLLLTDNRDLIRLRTPSLREIGWIVVGVVGILLAARVVGVIVSMLGIEVAQNQVVQTGRSNPRFFLYMIPVSLLLVGPFEELVFRGTVQGLLRRAWTPTGAIVVASALFGVVHYVALTGSGSRLSYVFIAAALGLILGFLYERTDNLLVPATVHGSYNALLFAGQYAVVTGLVG